MLTEQDRDTVRFLRALVENFERGGCGIVGETRHSLEARAFLGRLELGGEATERLRGLLARLVGNGCVEWGGQCGDIPSCFFCGERLPDYCDLDEVVGQANLHKPDCPWIEAKSIEVK